MNEIHSSHRGAERARNAAFATPFCLDAFLAVCLAHLCHLALHPANSPLTFAMQLGDLSTVDGWLILVLTPYAVLLALGTIWRYERTAVLYGGIATLSGVLMLVSC